jgi:drug/metabolite transporter (DMT)-like permease
VVVLGINWPIMKTGLDSIEPMWFAFLRCCRQCRRRHGRCRHGRLRPPAGLAGGAVVAVAQQAPGDPVLALQFVPAGRSSVLVWTAALWTVPVASIALRERMSPRRWAGLVSGIGGIILLFEPWRFTWSDGDVVLGNGLLLVTAMIQAGVIVHTRAHRWVTGPADALPWQMLVAALPLLVVAVVWGGGA